MSFINGENEQKLRAIAETLRVAARNIGKGEPVLYQVSDTTRLGIHATHVRHIPSENTALIELPESSMGLIMPLHAINALLYVIKPLIKDGKELSFPTLELVAHGQLVNKEGENTLLAKTDLRVVVPQAHYVIGNTQFKGEVLTVSSVIQQYYELVKLALFNEGVLDTVPVNVLFTTLRDNGLQPAQDKIALEVVADRNQGDSLKRYKMVHADKIKHSMQIGTV